MAIFVASVDENADRRGAIQSGDGFQEVFSSFLSCTSQVQYSTVLYYYYYTVALDLLNALGRVRC